MNVHCDHEIVERFTRTLSERLVSFQNSQGMNLTEGQRSREWVKRLSEDVAAVDAVKEKVVDGKPSTTFGLKEKKLDYSVRVRYLLSPGELEGGGKRATDPV